MLPSSRTALLGLALALCASLLLSFGATADPHPSGVAGYHPVNAVGDAHTALCPDQSATHPKPDKAAMLPAPVPADFLGLSDPPAHALPANLTADVALPASPLGVGVGTLGLT